jgi:hypothetical protein
MVEEIAAYVIQPGVKIFYRQVLERLRAIPGVESAALVDWLPLADNAQHAWPGFKIVGRSTNLSSEKPAVMLDGVSAGYPAYKRQTRCSGDSVLLGVERGVIDEKITDTKQW